MTTTSCALEASFWIPANQVAFCAVSSPTPSSLSYSPATTSPDHYPLRCEAYSSICSHLRTELQPPHALLTPEKRSHPSHLKGSSNS
ncbi:hypothetical protein GGP41_004340 [Bipolaris sorokiniana]|uniref:Uncharacterized protein n=1 Tax=Cochliobolus sativus TaxID=45130 RepID=A0A8H5ZPJ6_COCSA|nr:hypothetical protein GGP41_004340 [Bipolaris sorokiniana]